MEAGTTKNIESIIEKIRLKIIINMILNSIFFELHDLVNV